MRFAKTVVAAGAALVVGGLGVGVAQAATSSPAPSVSSSSSQHSSHENEARGRVAEGETHARHTGADDKARGAQRHNDDPATDRQGRAGVTEPGDDHGSGGHGADD